MAVSAIQAVHGADLWGLQHLREELATECTSRTCQEHDEAFSGTRRGAEIELLHNCTETCL